MKADLHLHTCASDGTWSPEALLENIKGAGIEVFAVTDHDSVENVIPTADLVKDTDLKFIRGVEVNTTENGHIFHILGYNIDPENGPLNEILQVNRNVMEERDKRCINILQEMDYPVTLDEFLVYENNPERGGWKALNYTMDKGLCHHYKEYFKLFGDKRSGLGIEGCAKPEAAIAVIRAAGGIPILAHPGSGLYGDNPQKTVSIALDLGIEGIECFHPENGDEATEYCLELCKRERLYITGGSDCHGTFVKERWLGKPDVDLDQLVLWEFEY